MMRRQSILPFPSRFVRVGDWQLHYLDEGSGVPVLMLHGNPTWCFMFRGLAQALRGNHRILVPDHLGCGLSDRPPPERYPYTFVQRVADLESFVNAVLDGSTPFHLVVHDWGGLIGTAYAVRQPERVLSLTVLNTAAFRVPPGSSLHWTLRFCRKSRVAAFLIRNLGAFNWGACLLGSRRGLSKEVRRGYLNPYRKRRDRLAVLRFVQDIPLKEGDPSYAAVCEMEEGLARLADKPVLIGWGMKDFIFDEAFLTRWQEFFPSAEIHRFPSAGHYVMEDAAEDLEVILRAFLERVES